MNKSKLVAIGPADMVTGVQTRILCLNLGNELSFLTTGIVAVEAGPPVTKYEATIRKSLLRDRIDKVCVHRTDRVPMRFCDDEFCFHDIIIPHNGIKVNYTSIVCTLYPYAWVSYP